MAAPRNRVVRNVLLAIAALAVAWLFFAAKHFLDVDRCMDRGGAWNKELDHCEM